jgi:predicted transcriptional regulator
MKTPAPSVRLSVRLTPELYARLQAFAMGRSHGHDTELSAIVREALEQFITPQRQTSTRQERRVSDRGA